MTGFLTYSTRTLLAASLLAVGLPAASQTVLLSDTFDRTSGLDENGIFGGFSDWGMNDNALPAGGSQVQTYFTTPTDPNDATQQYVTLDKDIPADFINDPDGDGVARLKRGGAGVNLDLTTLAPNGYIVNADMNRFGTTGGFLGIGFGLTPDEFNADVTPEDEFDDNWYSEEGFRIPLGVGNDFSALIRPAANNGDPGENGVDAEVQFWKADPSDFNDPELRVQTDNPFLLDDPERFYNVEMTVAPQTAGDWSEGALIDVTVVFDGNASKTYTDTITSDGVGLGYVSWYTNQPQKSINNLVISAIDAAGEILGDYNDNGLVEQGDLNQVLNNWGTDFASVAATWINQRPTEGIVDQAELNVVLNRWGSDSAPDFSGSAVPEPASLALLGLGALALRRRG